MQKYKILIDGKSDVISILDNMEAVVQDNERLHSIVKKVLGKTTIDFSEMVYFENQIKSFTKNSNSPKVKFVEIGTMQDHKGGCVWIQPTEVV